MSQQKDLELSSKKTNREVPVVRIQTAEGWKRAQIKKHKSSKPKV